MVLLLIMITIYNNFVDPDPPIIKDSTMEIILKCLLNNADVTALIIFTNEINSLLFKYNKKLGMQMKE
jgi:hypothetical protein